MSLKKINELDNVVKPGCVILDTDNTLYPYDPSHEYAMKKVQEKVVDSLGISPHDFQKTYKTSRSQIKDRLQGTASSHSRLLYFQRMLEILGLGSQVLMALDFEQTYWRSFLSETELFDGVKEFLDDLRLAKIHTAIITDLTAQIQFRKIIYLGLDQYFDHIITSEEAGYDKPHHAPFEVACEKLGTFSGPIWMIGDNPICDIQGAREAVGAVTFQKKHRGVEIFSGAAGPDYTFNNFTDLRKFFKDL